MWSDVTMEALNWQTIILFSKKKKSSIRDFFFVSQKIKSALRTVESVEDRISYIALISKDSFCEKLKYLCDHFLKYFMKVLTRDVNAKLCRENTLKATFGE